MLAQTSVVDLVSKDEHTGAYELLLVVEADEWPLPGCHTLLQEKLNSYLAYLLDGQMQTEHPDASISRVEILIQSEQAPSSITAAFIQKMADAARECGVTVRYVPSSS